MAARFTEPNLHARLLRRTVIGDVVIDHEWVTRSFPAGPGHMEMVCTYAVSEGLIQTASFVLGAPMLALESAGESPTDTPVKAAENVAGPGAPGAERRALPSAEVIGFDHLYLSVSDLGRAERFYDKVMIDTLGFRKSRFTLAADPHLQYYNRHFGLVLRAARSAQAHEPYAPGLHHACLRVDTIAEVQAVACRLQSLGIAATEAALYPAYAADYWATFFTDPDGIRLEVTNFRAERRERMEEWEI
jgi:catechol 2,3-dioxygenase-like lactoylglutathione lyase family enzyme